MSAAGAGESHVWYVAYGSNLLLARLRSYLSGGRARGALRANPGCRDQSDPVDSQATWLDGGLRFAGRSSVWGAGFACYEPWVSERVAARAYLLSFDQVCDLIAQETRRPQGVATVLHDAVVHGAAAMPTGLYGSLLRVGTLYERPMVTLAAAPGLQPAPPSSSYVRTIAAGLTETFDWSRGTVATYLVRWPGVGPRWTAAQIEAQVPPQPA